MNTDSLILRETDNLPLVNKNDFLDNADFDNNLIKIYNDFLSLLNSDFVDSYDAETTYNLGDYVVHNNTLWVSISTEPFSNVAPELDSPQWQDRFPTVLAHIQNRDSKLAEGTANEVTAEEIRNFIDGGLTTTTNLAVSENTFTSLKITSSTGTDALLTSATGTKAGLLSASDKLKLNGQSGINTGDQTLASLGAEAVANKVNDFSVINASLYPSVVAVSEFVTDNVGDIVGAFIGDSYANKRLETDSITSSRALTQEDESKIISISEVGLTTPITVILPNNDDEPIAVGSQFIFWLKSDSAAVDFAPQVESPQVVELYSAGGLTEFGDIGAVCSIVKVGVNSWLLTGRLI